MNKSAGKTLGQILQLIVLVVVAFYGAQLLVGGLIWLLVQIGVPLGQINEALFQTIATAAIYVIAIAIAVAVPWLVAKRKTTLEDIGLQRLPTWSEVGLAPLGFVAYMFVSAIIIAVLADILPWFDVTEAQEVGFNQLFQRYEFIVAFTTLVVIAPIAEEVLFRGFLYGKLKRVTWRWLAIILTSALFGALHGQWNVAVDTFVLSVAMCLLRDMTGSLWPAIIIHMIKNGIAYYFLFINPQILNTLGG